MAWCSLILKTYLNPQKPDIVWPPTTSARPWKGRQDFPCLHYPSQAAQFLHCYGLQGFHLQEESLWGWVTLASSPLSNTPFGSQSSGVLPPPPSPPPPLPPFLKLERTRNDQILGESKPRSKNTWILIPGPCHLLPLGAWAFISIWENRLPNFNWQ